MPTGHSLKGYTPALARLLNTTPAALYERQRALVRAGLLDMGEGRGPGSGVRSSYGAVAMLLLAVLATDRLSETEARTKAIAEARPVGRKYCPLTHSTNFRQAMSGLLLTTGRADRVIEVAISRTADRASIRYWDDDIPGGQRVSEFVGEHADEPGISVSAKLNQPLLQEIAKDVQAIVMEEFEE